ncbi:MAG: alkaline shock response membrane anchor protein AmaP [Atopobium sp.]|uniref:alkaline shock response membrane anchor protein AmaP n=1 Tax=Atopobium sp. TaxID=1872650 RepID=UPI002A75DDBD|nr:alkaline shock response membrane anchor protein AmaP [Atopobium sp.]MDY2788487.1 alkaline shock response membrane anchor protein AmaP [Atopobium sp.]
MSRFKRFCLFIYSLAGLLLFAVTALTLTSPWEEHMSALLLIPEYTYVLAVLAALTVLGLLATFITACTGRVPTVVVVAQTDEGDITVSREAIASQAAHVVAAAGDAQARDVYVNIGRNNKVDVFVKVVPFASMDVVVRGPELMEQLTTNLALLCGEHVGSVHISYLDARQATVLVEKDSKKDSAPATELDNFGSNLDNHNADKTSQARSSYDEILYIPTSASSTSGSTSDNASGSMSDGTANSAADALDATQTTSPTTTEEGN